MTRPPCSQLQSITRQRDQGMELSAQVALGDQWTVAGNNTSRDSTTDGNRVADGFTIFSLRGG